MQRTRVVRSTILATMLCACQAAGPRESSSEQAVVVLSVTSHDFGSLQTGSTSSAFEVTVGPYSFGQDTVTAVTRSAGSCADFTVDAPGLPADVYLICTVSCATFCFRPSDPTDPFDCQEYQEQDYKFQASFHPTVEGPVSCVVTVTTNGTTSTTITLTGTGTLPPRAVAVEPSSVSFGDVRRGTDSTPAQVTVRNTGGATLTVSSISLAASSSPGFVLAGPTGGYQLDSNMAQSHSVVCRPPATGSLTGQLVIATDDPSHPSVEVPLSCSGVDSSLDITPSPLALRTTRVGEPVDDMIELRNVGTAPMTLGNITLQSTGITMTATPTAGTILAAGTGVASVGVHFDAAVGGEASGTLVVAYDAAMRSAEIRARALATSMAVTPDGDVDFGPVCSGQRKTQEFTVLANQQGSFTIERISDLDPPFELPAPRPVQVDVQGAGATMVKFQVTAAPTVEGDATVPMVIHTNIPGAADHTVQLHAQALPAGVNATPPALQFGSRPVQVTTLGQTVHLVNCNSAPIGFTNARIEGADALDFAIVELPDSKMLAPSEAASWLIVLRAHTGGAKRARFAVDYEGGTVSAELTGEGIGDAGTGNTDRPDRGSYYACSSGSPAAPWPLAIALAWVMRRGTRRRPVA